MFRIMNGDFDMTDMIRDVKASFPNCFINLNYELILEPKNNIYFRLDNIQSELEFKCKVLAWLSRPSCKGLTERWQKKIRDGFNNLLGTKFNQKEMEMVYTYLGNDCNRSLSEKFIISGFYLNVLIEHAKTKGDNKWEEKLKLN